MNNKNIDQVSKNKKYFWNMMGSLCNAFSTVVLLWMVNWILGSVAGGIFSFAYTNAQLMLIIGGLEVRPIQSTDIKEEYSFPTYFTLRIMTCITMMIVCVIYVLISGVDQERAGIMIAFSAFKMVEAFTDVFGGMYQQKDRIDLAGKVFSLRVVFSTVAFGIVLLATKNLFVSAFAMGIVSFALFCFYDLQIIHLFPDIKFEICFEKIGFLLKEVIPLFIATFIISFISNAPKYVINTYCSDILQNKYNILFMPAFAINLFSIFVFRPVLVDMTKRWNEYDIAGVIRYMKRSIFFIMITTIICIGMGVMVGIPVLSILYHVNLSEDKLILGFVMLYGGLSAFSTYFYYVITVMRVQSKILVGYISSFIIITIVSPILVRRFELLGAVLASITASFVLNLIFIVIIIISIRKKKREQNK